MCLGGSVMVRKGAKREIVHDSLLKKGHLKKREERVRKREKDSESK